MFPRFPSPVPIRFLRPFKIVSQQRLSPEEPSQERLHQLHAQCSIFHRPIDILRGQPRTWSQTENTVTAPPSRPVDGPGGEGLSLTRWSSCGVGHHLEVQSSLQIVERYSSSKKSPTEQTCQSLDLAVGI